MIRSTQKLNCEEKGLLQNLKRLLSGEFKFDHGESESIASVLAAPWRRIESSASDDAEIRERSAAEIEDIGHAEQRARSEYSGRYPIELLQNAQDACAEADNPGRAWFRVSDTALLVANEGAPFDRERVTALLRFGGSSKKVGSGIRPTIGYKGIGFTSVFEVSDRPQIISRNFTFGFDRELALSEVRRRLGYDLACVPIRYYPFPLTCENWSEDQQRVDALFDSGAATVIRLPFRQGTDRNRVLASLKKILRATSLVLMPMLEGLEVEGIGSWRRTFGRKYAMGRVHHVSTAKGESVESWLLSTRRFPIDKEAIATVDDELWRDVSYLEVRVGIPWQRGRPHVGQPCPSIHTYFPTDDSVGRKVLLHGDFYLDSTRRHVQIEGAGHAITEAALKAIIDLAADCAEGVSRLFPDANNALVEIFSPHRQPEGFGHVLARDLDKKLAETPFIRSITRERVSPECSEVLDVALESKGAADFVAMMDGSNRLVVPDLSETIRRWLVELGASELSSREIVARLRPADAPTYDRAVRAVARWWRSTNR